MGAAAGEQHAGAGGEEAGCCAAEAVAGAGGSQLGQRQAGAQPDNARSVEPLSCRACRVHGTQHAHFDQAVPNINI